MRTAVAGWPDGHIPMPINASGNGPEMVESRVVGEICWCPSGASCKTVPPAWRTGYNHREDHS